MCEQRNHRGFSLEEIKAALIAAAGDLVVQDANLLARALYEPALTHRLAVHLESRFPTYNVDCEYDRNMDARKFLPEYGNARPDIIVHCREHNHPWNLLAVEAKKVGNSCRNDLRKLSGLKNPEGLYAYHVVALVLFGERSMLVDFGDEQPTLVPLQGEPLPPVPGGWLGREGHREQ